MFGWFSRHPLLRFLNLPILQANLGECLLKFMSRRWTLQVRPIDVVHGRRHTHHNSRRFQLYFTTCSLVPFHVRQFISTVSWGINISGLFVLVTLVVILNLILGVWIVDSQLKWASRHLDWTCIDATNHLTCAVRATKAHMRQATVLGDSLRRWAILLSHWEALPLLIQSIVLESFLPTTCRHALVEQDGEDHLSYRVFDLLIHLCKEAVKFD